MNKPMKAALLSALVLPGAGHLYLRKYLSGTVLLVAALGSLSLLVSKIFETALKIAEKIQSGAVPLDIAAIAELLSQQPTGPEARLPNIASVVLVIAWLIGIVDSYRVGQTKGHGNAASPLPPQSTGH